MSSTTIFALSRFLSQMNCEVTRLVVLMKNIEGEVMLMGWVGDL